MQTPRARLQLRGAAALSDRELVRVLLRDAPSWLALCAQRDEEVVVMLSRRHVSELVALGLTRKDAEAVAAAFELGRRVGAARRRVQRQLDEPSAAFAFVAPELVHEEREVVLVVVLDVRNRPVHVARVAQGAVDHCAIDPREVFVPALRERGSAVLLAHNHPSGDPTPSREDVELTRRLVAAGALLSLPLLDHLIVASGPQATDQRRFVSLASAGVVTPPRRLGREVTR